MKEKLLEALKEANLYSHEATRGALFAYNFITDQVTKMPLDKVIEWVGESIEERLKDKETETYTTPADAISNPPFEEQ